MKRLTLYALLGLFGLLLAGVISFAVFQPIQVLPRVRLSPGFSMIDQAGRPLHNEQLRGSIVVYGFGYSGCGADCQRTYQVLQEVQQGLKTLDTGGVPVQLVLISLDPAHETPASLAALAQELGADPAHWRLGLQNDPTLLKAIVGGGFEVFYQSRPDGSIQMDTAMTLVDPLGIIRGEYDDLGWPAESSRILRHISVLVTEIQNSSGAAKLAYEAAHLFLCYAP
jgi:protein SCO1